MYGVNELMLNPSTMNEIVQYYITNKMLATDVSSPEVTLVDKQGEGWFRVVINFGNP